MYPYTLFLLDTFSYSPATCRDISSGLLPSGFLTKMLYAFIIFPGMLHALLISPSSGEESNYKTRLYLMISSLLQHCLCQVKKINYPGRRVGTRTSDRMS
jgi:hypothetical protein